MRRKSSFYRTTVFIAFMVLFAGTFLIFLFGAPIHRAFTQGMGNAFDASKVSLEIKGIDSSNFISKYDGGDLQSVALAPGTSYEVALTTSGGDCRYHYSGENDSLVLGSERRTMIVSQEGQSVVHALVCTSPNGSLSVRKMLIVRIKPLETNIPMASASALTSPLLPPTR